MAPPAIYAALHVTTSTLAIPGQELEDPAYVRPLIAFMDTDRKGLTNARPLQFFTRAATRRHRIVEAALYDAPVKGNALYFGPLVASINVEPGDGVLFSVGTLTVEFDAFKDIIQPEPVVRVTAWARILEDD